MSLNHDFLLVNRKIDGEWELTKFIHDPRAIHLHDDLVRYLSDTLVWIPTFNPSKSQEQYGLNSWGVSIIDAKGAKIAENIFRAWSEVFALGPKTLVLSGSFSLDDEKYERLEFDRDEVVDVLQTLARYSRQVHDSHGVYYIYHGGV